MKRVEGKVAVVTGGARGIGKSTCELLAAEGARVAVTDIIDDEGEQIASDIRENGGDATYWHLDVSSEQEVEKTFQEIREELGVIDVLVNNAGIAGPNKPTHEISLQEWEKVTAINEKGLFLCTKYAIPQMKDNGGGSIINLSSIYGIIGAPDLPAYHASKGAVRVMTKTDALFYADQKIRVNSVHPGYVWTPLVAALAESSEEGKDAFRENLASMHPLGRVGRPEEIAAGILFLASDESRFMTGSEMVIDGGYTAR